jgi:hypothetical protein
VNQEVDIVPLVGKCKNYYHVPATGFQTSAPDTCLFVDLMLAKPARVEYGRSAASCIRIHRSGSVVTAFVADLFSTLRDSTAP